MRVAMVVLVGMWPAGATLLALLRSANWQFDLLTHFRVQYAVMLAATVIAAYLLKLRRTAIVFALPLVWNLALILPLYWPAPGRHATASPAIASATSLVLQLPLKLVHYNIHTGNTQHAQVVQYLNESDAGLLFLAEVNDRWFAVLTQGLTRYQLVVADPRPDNFGMAMFVRTDANPSMRVMSSRLVQLNDSVAAKSIETVLSWQDEELAILYTHPLPPVSGYAATIRDSQLAAAAQWANQRQGSRVILGDLNVTAWSTPFRDMLRNTNLLNSQSGFGVQPTWPIRGWVSLPFRIGIDHCLHSPDLLTSDRTLGPDTGSDHLPVEILLTRRR